MTSFSFVVIALALAAACVDAQTGSVHCGVGCACSELSRPVCGTDGRTYINECTLRCQQCEKLDLELRHEGVCEVLHHVEPVSYHPAPLVQYAYVPQTPITYIPRTPINYIPQYRYVINRPVSVLAPLPEPIVEPVVEPVVERVIERVVEKKEGLAPIFVLSKKI